MTEWIIEPDCDRGCSDNIFVLYGISLATYIKSIQVFVFSKARF